LIAALLSVLMALLAFNDAKEARVMVEYELNATRAEMEALKEEVELEQLIDMKNQAEDDK
jgi:hypothetical protein